MVSSVVVVGGINADTTLAVDRVPGAGETVVGAALSTACGGKGANQAVAAARRAEQVVLVGAVGDDDAGRRQLDALRAGGVGVGAVATVAGSATGMAVILLTGDGENRIVVAEGANAALGGQLLDRLLDEALTGPGVWLLAQSEVGPAAVERCARAARRRDAVLVLNPAPVVPVTAAVLAAARLLVVNEVEARQLLADLDAGLPAGTHPGTAAHDPARLAGALRQRASCAAVVLTLGAAGAVWADDLDVVAVPASPVDEVVDTTGAGDAFTGVLVASLAGGSGPREAMTRAAEAAARVVGVRGARAPVTA